LTRKLLLVSVIALLSFIGAWEEAPAVVKVGAGLFVVGDDVSPLGRLVVDVLPLWFVTVSIDVEYWFFSVTSQQLLPFLTASMPLIFRVAVGIAPIVVISSQGIGLVPDTFAVKGGLEVPVGPLGIFGEALVLVSSHDVYSDGYYLAFGVTLGF
jgi:hypothetical protein